MKKKKTGRFRKFRWLVLPLLAIGTWGFTQWFIHKPEIAESIYSRTVYPVFASLISRGSQVVSFSLDDVFYILLIVGLLVLIGLAIFRKISFRRFFRIFINSAAIIYILFYWLWGFNYFRDNMNKRLDIPVAKADLNEFNLVLKSFVSLTEKNYTAFDGFNPGVADSLVEVSYKKLAPFLEIKYPMGKRRAKKITFSQFFASAAISGYFGPFFNEVHINSYLLPLEYPVILAHEKAHQFGIVNEAEANFYAWLVCSQSPSKELRYSANLYILNYFLYEGRDFETIKDIVKTIDPKVKNDIVRLQNHWQELRNENIDKVATKANNIYLKTNNIKEGIKNYTGVVKLVMDYSGDKQAQETVSGLIHE